MDDDLTREQTIGDLAARQRGHVARSQLLKLGLGPAAIQYRVRSGRLLRVHPGVYAVGHRRPHPIDRSMAAVLACGPGAVLSHGSAAALWGFFKRWDEPFEVTVAVHRRPSGICVYRDKLTPADRRRQHGVPATSPARTVLDCAPRLRNLARFVNDALLSPWLTEGQLIEALARHPRPGLARSLVWDRPGITRSHLEDEFVVFCERFGIKTPELNVIVGGREVDAFFREEGVIVELDSWQFHKDRLAFERDRDKDADAIANGLRTVRITHERLTANEARRLRTILAARRS